MRRLTKNDVAEQFVENLERVKNLVKTYGVLVGPGAGRSSVEHADVLRAAVILLHATLESLVRSLEELRLLSANDDAFQDLRFVPYGKGAREAVTKFSLVELAKYRANTVKEVFEKAIDVHLDRSNYNNIADVKTALTRIGLDYGFLSNSDSADLEAMMKRRHLIAHRADRNPITGRGHHVAQSIGIRTVENWIVVMGKFGNIIIGQL